MHEYTMVAGVFDAAMEQVNRHRAVKVHSMLLEVGEFAFLTEEALQHAWQLLTPGTPLEGCEMQVRPVKGTIHCPACGYRGPVEVPSERREGRGTTERHDRYHDHHQDPLPDPGPDPAPRRGPVPEHRAPHPPVDNTSEGRLAHLQEAHGLPPLACPACKALPELVSGSGVVIRDMEMEVPEEL